MKTPTLKLRWRAEDKELAAKAETEAEAGESTDIAMEWTGPAAWMTKAMTYALIACLIAGPVALVLAYSALSRPAVAPAASVSTDAGKAADERAAVGDFAEAYVLTWLTTPNGSENRLAPFLANYAGITLPETPWTASAPSLAGITQGSDGTWSATVSVDVNEDSKGPATRRYFLVPVIYQDGALIAQALPAPVPAPASATAPNLGYTDHAGITDPVSVSVGEFLKALLVVNGGDVTRYTTPGAPIRSVSPAPYVAVDLEDVLVDRDISNVNQAAPATGTRVHLLVTATATGTDKRQITVQYALTLTARAGRWEVTAIDPAPLAQAPAPTASSSSSADGTGSQTGTGDTSDPATNPTTGTN